MANKLDSEKIALWIIIILFAGIIIFAMLKGLGVI